MACRTNLSRRRFLSAAMVGAGAVLTGCAVVSSPTPTPFRERGGATYSGPSRVVPGGSGLKKVLSGVLNEVNDKFVYKTDQAVYGINDYWVPANAATAWQGDCEDHALLCRQLLRQRGIHNGMLLTCWTEKGEYHCVLYVEGWVLDVRQPWVMSNTELQQLGYRWHKVGTDDGKWYYVDPAHSRAV